MANFTHRTAPTFQNSRGYNLRGLNHTPIALHKTARQQAKESIARGVKKNWQITRANKRSRGLHRRGNTCFRLSGIQGLLHTPKFVNWILSHDSLGPDGTRVFPCRARNAIETALLAKHSVTGRLRLASCPACVVKNFVQAYWGNQDMDANGEPRAWAHEHVHMRALRNLDRQLYVLTPGTSPGADTQQDPVEFQDRLLDACLESTDHTLAANASWNDQYEALFIMEWDTTWTCACGYQRPAPQFTVRNCIGLDSLAIERDGASDSISAAIARELTPEDLGIFLCATCGLWQTRTQTKKFEGPPEILRIKLNNIQEVHDSKGKVTGIRRNNNVVRLDPVLDLKAYQAVPDHPAPLKYQLRSVLCHGGGLVTGHWTATVSDPERVNFINDENVRGEAKRFLRSNPQHGMQGLVLTYVRMQTRDA